MLAQGAYQRADGLWAYQTVQARDLWDTIMKSAYDFAEPRHPVPGSHQHRQQPALLRENIAATNPCGEQPLPSLRLLRSGARSS